MKTILVDEEKLKDLYSIQKLSIVDCARILCASDTTIRRRLKKMNIDIRLCGEYTRDKNITDEQVIDLYWNQGLSLSQTAKKLGKSDGFVKRRLYKSGRGTRGLSESIRKIKGSDHISNEELIRLHDEEKWSCSKISRHFDKSKEFVRQRFMVIGKARRRNVGEFNGSWKGGTKPTKEAIRTCARYKRWMDSICSSQKHKSKISNKLGNLHYHHIYPFSIIFRSSHTKHQILADTDQHLAIVHDTRFYDVENGIGLLEEEHLKIEASPQDAHPLWKIWQAYPDFTVSYGNLTHNDFSCFNDRGQIQPINYKIRKATCQDIKTILRYEHYLGTIPPHSLILTATIGKIIVGIAIFGRGANQYISKDTWELTRLCTPYYVVRPFSCEFLSQCCIYIKKNHNDIKHLIAYADSAVGHSGGVYRMAQWSKAGKTESSYMYFDPITFELKHKSCCRRVSGIDKTEKQISAERGLIKIQTAYKHRYTYDLG